MASHREGARGRAKGMDGMSRTSTTAGARRRVPAWTTAAAVVAVLALALVWRVVPASADTVPVTTPTVAPTTVATIAPTTAATIAPTTVATVAPTTVATVAPTTVATVAPTTVATAAPTTVATVAAKTSGSVGTRAYPPSPGDQCATPVVLSETDAWPTSSSTVGKCVAELILATPTVPSGDEGWRVGDVVELTLSVVNHGANSVDVSGVDAFIDFTLSDLELVTGSYASTVLPVTAESGACDTSCDKHAFDVSGGIFASANADDIVENYYYTASTVGRLNFSAGLRIPATITTSAPAVVGTLKFRVKSNPSASVTASAPDSTYAITLRNRNQAMSGASGWRNSAIVGVGTIGDAAMNIMGRAKDLPLPVERTEIALRLVPTVVTGLADIRVGDVVPVDLKLKATTIIRNMTSLDASVSFDFAKFVLVDSTGAVIAPASATATTLNGSGFAFGDSGTTAITGGNLHAQTTSGSNTTSTVTLKINGAALSKVKDNESTVVRFFVRPKDNGATTDTNNPLTLGASPTIGMRANDNSLGFQSYVTTGATSPATGAMDYPVTVKHTKITLALVVATPADANRGHRTGDTIKVDLTATATDLARNVTSLRTTISVPKADFVLVDGTGSKSFATAPVLKASATEAFGATSASQATFDLTTSSSTGPGIVTVAIVGSAIDLPNTTAKVIGSIYVRPRYNGTSGGPVSRNVSVGADASIGIKQLTTDNGYTVNDLGFPVEVGGSAANGPAATGSVSVKQTVVGLKMVPTLPNPLRIGDEVAVALFAVPDAASYVNHLHTESTVTGADFQVVAHSGFISLTSSVVASEAAFNGTPSETISTNSYDSDTITLDVSGTCLTAGATDVKVGTFFVRPRKKVLTNPVFVAPNLIADEIQTGDVATIYGANLFAVDTSPAVATPAVTSALGTLGVGLEVRSPTADHPGLDYDGDPTTWKSLALGATQSGAINVVDGRYLDVKVVIDSAATAGYEKKVDIFTIDLAVNAAQLTLKSLNGFILPASSDVSDTVTQAGSSVALRLTSNALLGTSTEVARLRFELAATPQGADATAPIVLKVADTTVLKQKDASGIFNYDNYADPVSPATIGEFDHGPTATRQTPATLQISTLLQGRTPDNDASRFVQTMRMELRPVTTTSAAVRHLTVTATPESVHVASSSPVSGMQYDRVTVKRPDDSGTKFAEAQFKDLSVGATGPAALADLEPGTYDVYLKGESSIAVVVQAVTFAPAAQKSITGLVLREGDLDQAGGSLDTVGTSDFSAFTPKWGKVVSQSLLDEASAAGDAFPQSRIDLGAAAVLADLNRSGYVDIFDFSLLASNYNKGGPFCAPVSAGCTTAGNYVWGTDSGAVSVSRVSAASANPTASLAVAIGTTDASGVVPVTVSVAPGSRAVDGVQVNLKTAPGVQIVDAPAGGTFAPAETNPMPVVLQQAWDAAKGIVSLGLGRAPSTGGITSPATLGTVYVKVPAGFTGAPVSISRTDGPFTTALASAGLDVTGSLSVTVAGGTLTIDVGTVVDDAPMHEVIVNGTGPVRAPVVAPVAGIAPSRSANRVVSPSITENVAVGTVLVSVVGGRTVELKTGLATTTPDAFCPVARHKTYIRLEDTGIAGATFGVEAGGVLSWVTPDQAGCVNWNAISEGGLTFTKETIMQFQLAQAVPGALLWVLDGNRNGELYEVDAQGVANYVTADAFAANRDHFTEVWANVIPVSTSQIEGLSARGSVHR